MSRAAAAFTLLEVMASLLVITVGMVAVIGMILYATVIAGRAQAAATAMATALTVLDDPAPLGAIDWGHTPAPLAGGTGDAAGMLNGYYVHRREISSGLVADGLAGLEIHVDVYQSLGGALVASLSTRRVLRN